MIDKNKLGQALPSSSDELGRDSLFQDRLKILVDAVGNPNAFARLTGLSVSGLKRYLNGGEPSVTKLLQVCDATGVNANWLMTGKGLILEENEEHYLSKKRQLAMLINDEKTLEELDSKGFDSASKMVKRYSKLKDSFDFLTDGSKEVLSTALTLASKEFTEELLEQAIEEVSSNMLIEKDFVLIPGYNVQVSAGFGSVGNDAVIPTRHLAFRKKWLQYKGFKQQDLIALWAKGDSMEPSIGDNNTLIIHTSEKKPVDGNIYIFRLEDQLVVKRVQVNLFGTYLLISDNSFYPPMEIKKEDMEQFEVIGRVVHIAKDI